MTRRKKRRTRKRRKTALHGHRRMPTNDDQATHRWATFLRRRRVRPSAPAQFRRDLRAERRPTGSRVPLLSHTRMSAASRRQHFDTPPTRRADLSLSPSPTLATAGRRRLSKPQPTRSNTSRVARVLRTTLRRRPCATATSRLTTGAPATDQARLASPVGGRAVDPGTRSHRTRMIAGTARASPRAQRQPQPSALGLVCGTALTAGGRLRTSGGRRETSRRCRLRRRSRRAGRRRSASRWRAVLPSRGGKKGNSWRSLRMGGHESEMTEFYRTKRGLVFLQ